MPACGVTCAPARRANRASAIITTAARVSTESRRTEGSDEPRGSCGPKGGHELAEAFKKKLFERGLKRIVRPNKALCLDQCAMGCTVVVYPEQVWYGKVTVADVDEIIESHILGGKPVQR